MEKITYKNRERTDRGILESFNELPLEIQKIFLEIKEKILELSNIDNRVLIYGSYLKGYWDEFSDYDIIIIGNITYNEVLKIKESFDFKLDIVTSKIFKPEVPSIEIP